MRKASLVDAIWNATPAAARTVHRHRRYVALHPHTPLAALSHAELRKLARSCGTTGIAIEAPPSNSYRGFRIERWVGVGARPTTLASARRGDITGGPRQERGYLIHIPDGGTKLVTTQKKAIEYIDNYLGDSNSAHGTANAATPLRTLRSGRLVILVTTVGRETLAAVQHEGRTLWSGAIGRNGTAMSDADVVDAALSSASADENEPGRRAGEIEELAAHGPRYRPGDYLRPDWKLDGGETSNRSATRSILPFRYRRGQRVRDNTGERGDGTVLKAERTAIGDNYLVAWDRFGPGVATGGAPRRRCPPRTRTAAAARPHGPRRRVLQLPPRARPKDGHRLRRRRSRRSAGGLPRLYVQPPDGARGDSVVGCPHGPPPATLLAIALLLLLVFGGGGLYYRPDASNWAFSPLAILLIVLAFLVLTGRVRFLREPTRTPMARTERPPARRRETPGRPPGVAARHAYTIEAPFGMSVDLARTLTVRPEGPDQIANMRVVEISVGEALVFLGGVLPGAAARRLPARRRARPRDRRVPAPRRNGRHGRRREPDAPQPPCSCGPPAGAKALPPLPPMPQ